MTNKFSLLSMLDNSTLNKLKIPAGSVVFVEGNRCDGIAIICKGIVRVSKIGTTGREIILYRVFPGEPCILTLSCALSGLHYPATATIEEDAEVVLVPVKQFGNWLSQNDSVRQFVYGQFTERLLSVMTLIEEVAFRKIDQRLAEFLYEKTAKTNIIEATHDEIACELGTAREVVSRLLKDFQNDSVLDLFRGRIIVKDRNLLKKIPL